MTEKNQLDRFKEAARQLEADESEVAFDEKLKAVVKHKDLRLHANPSKKSSKK